MKLLLDECVPEMLSGALAGHQVFTIAEAGLKGLSNGSLLKTAAETFDALLTIDRGFEHQQNLANLPIAVLVVRAPSNRIADLVPKIPAILNALERISPREFMKVGI
jgi:hypothetical protein